MQVKTSNVMIMGTSMREYNGQMYYNVDIYDSQSGSLFGCGCDEYIYGRLSLMDMPVMASSVTLDIQRPYQGRSRLQLEGWGE